MGASWDDSEQPNVNNDISGTVYGTTGQFGNVYGDVHIHGPSSMPHPPKTEPSQQGEAVAGAKRRKRDRAKTKRKRRKADGRARQQRREEDRKAIKGCGLLVLLLGVSGFVALGLYTREWATAGVLMGVVAIIVFLWGAGMAMHDD
ncbi:hypothetical protein P2Q00_42805 [Streptomyces coacervatus]|uniref:hypothetical protein n=1 Tax=Streptomyces coacervatus TaxID=647381 RepID=UPI0023DB5B26|nr:hypothetical protein [Streptomyces coacervatus]MDF2272096.1 hypothetical protein [Streptomyces coacervatus]